MIVTPAPYLPFLDPHKGRPPGMYALPPADWIEIDAAYAAQMAYRERIVAEEGTDAIDALAEAGPAVAELAETVTAHLLDRYPDRFARGEGGLRRADGVVVEETGDVGFLARVVQEDLCLLSRDAGADEHRLIAATLCFPSHWRLQDKLGKPLRAIHAPVPNYEHELAPRVERLHQALAEERPLQRLNYTVQGVDELRLDDRVYGRPESQSHYLRVERQTLRRLPRTGAVVFGIKTYVTPVEDLPREALSALADKLGAMLADERAYKGGDAFVSAAARRLRTLAAGGEAEI